MIGFFLRRFQNSNRGFGGTLVSLLRRRNPQDSSGNHLVACSIKGQQEGPLEGTPNPNTLYNLYIPLI